MRARLGVARIAGQMLLVEFPEKVLAGDPLRGLGLSAGEIGNGSIGVERRPLKNRRQKRLPQLLGPTCGTPRGLGMATNAGRSELGLPRA